MDISEVLCGIFLLMLGVLAVVPLPFDGWFIWFPPDPSMTTLVIAVVVFCFVLGFYLVVAGFRSKKKSQMREVVGYACIILSCLVLLAGLAAESENWTTVSLILGIGSLILGAVLVIRTRSRRNAERAHRYLDTVQTSSTESVSKARYLSNNLNR